MPVSESATGLRIGHLNVYHLYNKVPGVSLLLDQSSQLAHLSGISETRLDSRIDTNSIRIPTYCVMRRDSTQTLPRVLHYTSISPLLCLLVVALTLNPTGWNVTG